MNEQKRPTERPKLSAEIQRQITELHASCPYDGRRVTLRENRGGWRWTGLSGITTCSSGSIKTYSEGAGTSALGA